MYKLASLSKSDKWKIKLGWGVGGLAQYIMFQTIFVLALPIYQVAMGVDVVKLGIIMAIPRLIDAVTDPVMGYISDNTHSRFGRRKPYILVGAIVCGIILPLLWMPPFESEIAKLLYFLFFLCFYAIAFTMFDVPYTAMGFEQTDDYDERTSILAWRMYLGILGMLGMPWIYKLCFWDYWGGDEIVGARWVSGGLGIMVIGLGILPVIFGRETKHEISRNRIRIKEAVRYTFSNKPFILLLTTNYLVRVGIASISTVILYINIFWICAEFPAPKEKTATIIGVVGTMMGLTSYISLPFATWVSKKTSKRKAMLVSFSIAFVGALTNIFAMDPKWPYMQILSSVISNFGMIACWLLISSMVADICDEDELKSGHRREGSFGAMLSLTEKMAFASSLGLTGFVLMMCGYESSMSETNEVPLSVVHKMKFYYILFQCIAIAIGMVLISFFSITREKAEETTRLLEQKRAVSFVND